MQANGLLHHIEIYVSNLEKSTIFWGWLLTEIFEYKEVSRWAEGISFKFGLTYLVFVQTEPEYLPNNYHRKNTGLNHLAFHCESAEFVNNLTDLLIQKNIPILYPDMHPYAGGKGYYAVFFEDPDRMKVEVVASFPKL
jgi:catechol 2,3-dioxygenase-like lactoylglutathione lyase family enzyme